MRVVVIGGTRFVGPLSVQLLLEAGHDVAIAHTGTHEHPGTTVVEHLHGGRADLLAPGGLVQRWRPEVLVDTFGGGATAEKADQVVGCAKRVGSSRIVAVSSVDVYQYCVEAGIGDGSGFMSMPARPLPLDEGAPLRGRPYPGSTAGHDNVAMEARLRDAAPAAVTVLRPGAIYGAGVRVREWFLVEKVYRGEHRLELPDGGDQFFHRVAVERVAAAVVAALHRAPDGFWTCNIVDPYDWTFAGLARAVGQLLEWEWEPVRVAFSEADHPWKTAHPVLASDRRLREVLRVTRPDPREALATTVRWLWDNRETLRTP